MSNAQQVSKRCRVVLYRTGQPEPLLIIASVSEGVGRMLLQDWYFTQGIWESHGQLSGIESIALELQQPDGRWTHIYANPSPWRR